MEKDEQLEMAAAEDDAHCHQLPPLSGCLLLFLERHSFSWSISNLYSFPKEKIIIIKKNQGCRCTWQLHVLARTGRMLSMLNYLC